MPPKMTRFSTLLMWLSRAALVAFPVGVIWVAILRFGQPDLLAAAMPGTAEVGAAPPVLRALGVALLISPAVPIFIALWHMQALFACYRAGNTLSKAPARHIHNVGLGVTMAAVLGLVSRPMATAALTLSNPPGARMIAVDISTSDVGLLLTGGLLIVIGSVMREAARVAEDNRGFV